MVCCRPGRRKGIDQPSTFYLFFLPTTNIFFSPPRKNPYNAMVDRLDRKRTSIAAPEKRSLEAYFAVQPRPSGEKIAAIAEKLDLKKNVVRVWFCNQRQKEKRMTPPQCGTEYPSLDDQSNSGPASAGLYDSQPQPHPHDPHMPPHMGQCSPLHHPQHQHSPPMMSPSQHQQQHLVQQQPHNMTSH